MPDWQMHSGQPRGHAINNFLLNVGIIAAILSLAPAALVQ